MARQPVALVLTLGLVACEEGYRHTHAFDGPVHSVILDHREMGPYEDAVGFISSSRNGRIVPLDLKHGTMLSDQVAAPFIRPRWLATGTRRILGQLAVYSPDDIQVSVYAADTANDVLLEIPYVIDMDPNPVIQTASHTAPVFEDTDGSGDDPAISDISLTNGWTTTETWTVVFDGTIWKTEGSRSGLQSQQASEGERFESDNNEISFTINGKASRGDRFSFETDTGIVEHDLGGTILAMERAPETEHLVAAVWDPLTERSSIVVWDIRQRMERGRYLLPEDSQAWRLAFGETIADVFVADAQNPQLFKLTLNHESPELSAHDVIETAAPVSTLAWVSDGLTDMEQRLEDEDTGALFEDPSVDRDYEHLFVGLVGLSRVDVYDVRARTWVDVNPMDEIAGGFQLESPIVGLSSTPNRVLLQERNDVGNRVIGKAVAATMYNGAVVLLEADSGCAALDFEGPHVPQNQGFESIVFSDVGNASNPDMVADDATGRRIQMSRCGGLVRTEEWTVTFDEVLGNWEVKGTMSGVQSQRAVDGERWVSDNGGFSFTMVAGSRPASEGDTFNFFTDEGILRIDAIERGDGQIMPLELPAEPTVFQYLAGPTDDGWYDVDERTFILVPVTNSDLVIRIRIKAWRIEAVWD